VSQTDPSSVCGVAPSDADAPFIVQKRGGQDGSPNVVLAASQAFVLFNGLGAASSPSLVPPPLVIDITNPTGGACAQAAGPMRCLRVVVSASGAAKMCDPAVTDLADPRAC
jgi:type IV fimbrial biogenesis protein FimT